MWLMLSKNNLDIATCRRYSAGPTFLFILPLLLRPNALFSSWTVHAMKAVKPMFPSAFVWSCN